MGAGAGHAYGDGFVKPHPDEYGTLVWTDQPCGRFGRDVRLGLSPGTEVRSPLESPMLSPCADTLCYKYVLLDRRVEHGDYVVRYIVRNKLDYAVNGGYSMPPGAEVYHHDYYGGNQTAAGFDYSLHHIPGAFHPGFSFAPSHVPYNPVHAGTTVNGVGETLVQDISQETQILKESAKTTQTSGAHQTLNTHSEGSKVKYTEYEGEQRNISIGGRSTEKSKMAEVDIGRIHANVGVTGQVHHHGDVSRGAQYEAYVLGEALDVAIGKNTTRQSGSGEFLQSKSVRETAESSMEQVAQTSGVHQILNTHSEGTQVKHTEYEGEQRNISIGERSTEKSKTAEVDIGRIHANVGVVEQVHHHGDVSRGAQYEAHASGEALDVTVLAGGKNTTRQSGTGEFLQSKSVQESAESSMRQVAQTSTSTENITTTQTSAGLANGNMTGHVSVSESYGQYGGQNVARVTLDF